MISFLLSSDDENIRTIVAGHVKFEKDLTLIRVRVGAVGLGTAIQVGRARFRFPMVSLEFFNHTLHTDFNVPYVNDVIHERINKHHIKLEAHRNPLLEPLLQPVNNRRL